MIKEHSYKSENFKTHETENENGSTSSYDISGKQIVIKISKKVLKHVIPMTKPFYHDRSDGGKQDRDICG